ncbi:MAG TPA: anaerobic glycerol-3-phosphate dehydrogenase subunit C [Terriglobales bacterium]|jgi:glycerol-3-phosphate dehydrogenase subunit C
MRDDDLKLDNCVKCSDCNAVCPVSKVFPDYAGPKALGPDMERFRREGIASDSRWVEYCLGCHRCDVACPHGVNISELIAKGKAQHVKSGRAALRDHWLARPSTLGKLCSSVAPIANAVMNLKVNRLLMSSFGEMTAERELPAYHSTPIRPRLSNHGSTAALFFPGCYIRYNNPRLGQIVVDLLAMNGFSVNVASDICCGMPAIANGDTAQLNDCVQQNVRQMVEAVDRGALIVTACTSCGYALKADYAHLLSGHPTLSYAAQKVSAAPYDLGELLADRLQAGKLNTNFAVSKHRLAYHAPCHLKSQGIGRPWLQLLRAVPGIEIEEIKADCCGMAGTYGFKKEKYNISMDIGRDLFRGILGYKPDLAVTECGSCQMQIEHGTQVRTLHPAEILYQACQGSPSTPMQSLG